MVTPDLEEQAVAALWESGCLGVQVVSSGSLPRLTLDAYYPSQAGRKRLGGRLKRALRIAGLSQTPPPRLSAVGPGRWVEAWQRTLRPMVVEDFLIVPEGCRTPSKSRGRPIVRVRYGQAFGTGEHASTRLCLGLLRRHLEPGASVADLGTGSGILAMAACRLGAGRVVAVDDDPVALSVARANVRENDLTRRIEVVCADAASAEPLGPFDLSIVNIGATTIKRILPALHADLRPGGAAILSGILIEDEGAVLAAAAAHDLTLVERRRSNPWSALVLRRKTGYARSRRTA